MGAATHRLHDSDVEVPATGVTQGVTYPDVGVRFGGASSFMMAPDGRKRSLDVSFDFVAKDQNIGGDRTPNRLTGNGDPSFVRTVLSSEIARRSIAVPGATSCAW